MAVTQASLTIETRTDAMPIDPDRTAVVVVDMQNDFATPGGMFERAHVDLTGIRATIAPTAKVIAAARAHGWLRRSCRRRPCAVVDSAGEERRPDLARKSAM